MMGIRRPGTKGYEEVEGVNIPTNPNQTSNGTGIINNNHLAAPEFELASVSVVPDGDNDSHENFSSSAYKYTFDLFRYFYSCAGGQRIRIWMVPSQVIAFRWPLLDVRLNGDDDTFSSWSSSSL